MKIQKIQKTLHTYTGTSANRQRLKEYAAKTGKTMSEVLDQFSATIGEQDNDSLAEQHEEATLAANTLLSKAEQSAADFLMAAEQSAAESLAEAEQSATESLVAARQSAAEYLAEAEQSAAEYLARARKSAAESLAKL